MNAQLECQCWCTCKKELDKDFWKEDPNAPPRPRGFAHVCPACYNEEHLSSEERLAKREKLTERAPPPPPKTELDSLADSLTELSVAVKAGRIDVGKIRALLEEVKK